MRKIILFMKAVDFLIVLGYEINIPADQAIEGLSVD